MSNYTLVNKVMNEFKLTYINNLKGMYLEALDINKNDDPEKAFDVISGADAYLGEITNLVQDYLERRIDAEDALNDIQQDIAIYNKAKYLKDHKDDED